MNNLKLVRLIKQWQNSHERIVLDNLLQQLNNQVIYQSRKNC